MSADYQNEFSAYFMQKIKSNTSCDTTLLKFLGHPLGQSRPLPKKLGRINPELYN